jgi:16S rRNA (cytidine1402-2'-O)-methyltransferase
MLYIVATPIGNVKDMSLRAIEVLSLCDKILCEDTRTSAFLLNYYDIKKPLESFHKFNEKSKEEKIINELEEGKNIAMISDAGTPIFSDPGVSLISACRHRNIDVTSIPGACSVIQALTLSGLSACPFQFHGFLPKKESQKKTIIKKMASYNGTSICFESPHRIIKTLTLINEITPDTTITIAREMTKKFEEVLQNTPSLLLQHFEKKPPKGEMVLLYPPSTSPLNDLSLEELLPLLCETYGLTINEAITLSSKLTKSKKRDIYNQVIKKNNR